MEQIKEELPEPILLEDLGALYPTESSKQKRRYGIYKCGFCGTEFKARTSYVKFGKTKSCGCYNKRRASETHKTHGLTETRLYRVWLNMKDRVFNIKHKQYNDYGGRGITICDEWKNDFMSFYNWAMSNVYSDDLSIDRIDNNGNYCPENCRWTTPTLQMRNQRKRRDNTSGYKGVYYNKETGRYRARIDVNKKQIYLGQFLTAVEGAIAYNNYIIENNLEGFILNEISTEPFLG